MGKAVLSLFIVVMVALKYGSAHVELDYYWRDYTGLIPHDAVPGGLDSNNDTTYLGQLLVMNGGIQQGLQPVRIYKGQKSVTASRGGIITSDKFVKILCSTKPENFYWEDARAETLHSTTIGKHLVQAGVESDKIINFGRAQFQGELIVGKVCSYNINDALMYFPYEGVGHDTKFYQVLVYKGRPPVPEVTKY